MRTAGKADALSLLGLARKAGAVAPGTDAARRAASSGQARLLVLASDGAPGQLDKIRRAARRTGVPLVRGPERETLGRAVGRSPLSALAVTKNSFAQELGRRFPPAEVGDSEGAGRRR